MVAIQRLVRQVKRPRGIYVKVIAVTLLGLCFIFIWSMYWPSTSSVTFKRSSFSDIAEPVGARGRDYRVQPKQPEVAKEKVEEQITKGEKAGNLGKGDGGKKNERLDKKVQKVDSKKQNVTQVEEESEKEESDEQSVGEDELGEDKEEEVDQNEDINDEIDGEGELDASREEERLGKMEEETRTIGKKRKKLEPLFDIKTHYIWKICNVRSKHNYVPCIDIERATPRLKLYRHHERICLKAPPMCLVSLPPKGYETPIHWPESKSKILYKNVEHPRLASYIKNRSWVKQSEEFLTFPQNQSEIKGGALHYIDSIVEMVPDIEWGKNIRLVLDIGCTDSSFSGTLYEKDVLTLSLGLKDDLVDLAQVALERGFPAIMSPLRLRRLPFPSGVFDAIHCGECTIPWHSNGGKLILEMNRILRPGGYFILSTKHDSIEEEEAMLTLTASICWNTLAHKTEEISEVGVKIYQKSENNEIFELRGKKNPPICKEDENPDVAWYVLIKTCVHTIPTSIEQHGSEWPEEWPKRLESYPEWLNNKDTVVANIEHWKAIVDKSYLIGMGINWSHVRNILDMRSMYGGFAAALATKQVWVMSVVPVHSPDTLPVIYERGLLGIYHDWCESFGTYPRTYDLLHADHLFSRLKNRCKQPVGIVVEMDRILRPGGWAIFRDRIEILDPLEAILRSLHWDIRMTYGKDKEGIMCAQKTLWRP